MAYFTKGRCIGLILYIYLNFHVTQSGQSIVILAFGSPISLDLVCNLYNGLWSVSHHHNITHMKCCSGFTKNALWNIYLIYDLHPITKDTNFSVTFMGTGLHLWHKEMECFGLGNELSSLCFVTWINGLLLAWWSTFIYVCLYEFRQIIFPLSSIF